MTKKILLIGRASTGKTSIKNAIFEGANPSNLMIKPLEPTRGILTYTYKWMDLQVSLFDSSGQEINDLFNNQEQQNRAFNQADAVIYIFDYSLWISRPQEIVEEIHKVYHLIQKSYEKTKLILIFHKIDLIKIKLRGGFRHLREYIKKLINLPVDIPLYFTSIYPKIIYNTFNAFFEILSSFSEESINIKRIINNHVKFLTKSICFVTNQSNQIIIQTMTNDFNIADINPIHQIFIDLDNNSKELEENYGKPLLLGVGKEIYIFLISDLELVKNQINALIFVSELKNKEKVQELVNKIRKDLKNFYEINKLK